MGTLFFKQLITLTWKNWIILSKHKLLNALRCVLLPIAYGVFLSIAQTLLLKPNNYGLGTAIPVYNLKDHFDGSLSLIWADGTNGTGNPSAGAVMSYILRDFNEKQLASVYQAASPGDIPSHCPQNFALQSQCFAAIAFTYLPTSTIDTTPVNYTISADGSLGYINVYSHTSDFETRIFPLQLAIDEAIITLRSGQSIRTPLELPFSLETNQQQATNSRLSFIRGIRNLLVLALFLCFIGIAYQLPGAFAGERANLLTSHMKAMGLLDSARIVSWHVNMSVAYLPAWIIVSLLWHYRIFTMTNPGLVLAVHLVLGLSLASWSFFVAVPFAKSPQLAAVASTLLSFVFAILALVFSRAGTVAAAIFTLVFPPGYYVFAIRSICGWENHLTATNLLKPDPDTNLTLMPILLVAIVDIFLWPYLAVLLERHLYDARAPSSGLWSRLRGQARPELPHHPDNTAISIRSLSKVFKPSWLYRRKFPVIAIADLSFDIPNTGIFVLLGSNGAGKSTSLTIIANLLGHTSGTITFDGGTTRPPRGTLGIVPQQNVLFPDLTCYQTLRVWCAIKHSSDSRSTNYKEESKRILRDCDLGSLMHSNANTLSGGQKRKLQLAIGLVGGSKIVLVDECTSGVDPLSRRALWRTLTSVKLDRTIVLTTHFLDEADFLADNIVVLAAPGKLVAQGTPVSLKNSLGHGYTVQVTFDLTGRMEEKDLPTVLLQRIRDLAPQCTLYQAVPFQASYQLQSKNPDVVEQVLRLLDEEGSQYCVKSYDILSTSMEDIFLQLMTREMGRTSDDIEKPVQSSAGSSSPALQSIVPPASVPAALSLTNGRAQSPFRQALTIFHKRALIFRRSWLTLFLAVVVAICGSTIPLVFLRNQPPTCTLVYQTEKPIPVYWPLSPISVQTSGPQTILTSPPDITTTLGPTANYIQLENIPDNATFVSTIQQNYLNISSGGVSIDMQTGESLVAWQTSLPALIGMAMLNLATNILYDRALNITGNAAGVANLIEANYSIFPPVASGTLADLRWVAFFGAAMAVYPAFFAVYVSRERRSAVQAMQFSNGLSNPAGLWLGHFLWDSIFSVTISTVITIIFATTSNQFHGLGHFWLVLVLYGNASIFFAYCVSIFLSSPLSAFAAAAGYQVIIYIVYIAVYLSILTFGKASEASQLITVIHFSLSILAPIASLMRATFVSVNLFSLLCDGTRPATTASLGDIIRFGGPIVYLLLYAPILFAVLLLADSGFVKSPRLLKNCMYRAHSDHVQRRSNVDIALEANAVSQSTDALRVLGATKSFNGTRVVDNVSFGVSEDTVFALLGPNGAGKTTTLNMIRGDIVPDSGDILIDRVSVITSPKDARISLGVCPQFTAIDTQLTVHEHLQIYGRLRGLKCGDELDLNTESLMRATSLSMYADRLASQLSGGNQRKLALAIALIGNPSVVLIDEFSSGIDAKTKREMWFVLRRVAVGKAVIITTHSMEEASALASKVGIMSKRILAVGTIEDLASRYATYQVQFSCRTREDLVQARVAMSSIPGARLADDVSTRFEVPIQEGGDMTLARLFHILSSQRHFQEYTVEKATLESIFLQVVRENDVEDNHTVPRRFRFGLC